MTSNSVWQTVKQQQIFRALLKSFSYPGELLTSEQDEDNLIALLAALLDSHSSICDVSGTISAVDKMRLDCPEVTLQEARFVVALAEKPAISSPCLGKLERPELGATIILKLSQLGSGKQTFNLEGPGVNGSRKLKLEGFNQSWLTARQRWNSSFPLGVDMILVTSEQFCAWPRTLKVTEI